MIFNVSIITNWKLPYSYRTNYIDSFMTELGYKFIAEGRHRRTYMSPNKRFVIKIPHNEEGLAANRSEAKIYSKHKNKPDEKKGGAVYAPCKIIQNTVLMMQAVVSSFGHSFGDEESFDRKMIKIARKKQPDWVENIDCGQAGITRNGIIVAFDYAKD